MERLDLQTNCSGLDETGKLECDTHMQTKQRKKHKYAETIPNSTHTHTMLFRIIFDIPSFRQVEDFHGTDTRRVFSHGQIGFKVSRGSGSEGTAKTRSRNRSIETTRPEHGAQEFVFCKHPYRHDKRAL